MNLHNNMKNIGLMTKQIYFVIVLLFVFIYTPQNLMAARGVTIAEDFVLETETEGLFAVPFKPTDKQQAFISGSQEQVVAWEKRQGWQSSFWPLLRSRKINSHYGVISFSGVSRRGEEKYTTPVVFALLMELRKSGTIEFTGTYLVWEGEKEIETFESAGPDMICRVFRKEAKVDLGPVEY